MFNKLKVILQYSFRGVVDKIKKNGEHNED